MFCFFEKEGQKTETPIWAKVGQFRLAKVGQHLLAKVGLAKVGLAKVGQIRMANVGLGKVGISRAATEGMGLQSILNDFCLCGHVAIKSDATAAIGMVHWLGLGKVRPTFGCWRLVGATPCSFREYSSLHNVRTGESERRQTKYLGPERLSRHTKACNWVPVVDDGQKWSRMGPKRRKRTACSCGEVFSFS